MESTLQAMPVEETPVSPVHALRSGVPLPRNEFAAVRRRLMFDGCKWDPQIGDTDTLAPFPLMIAAGEWRRLERLAEKLAEETDLLESAVLERPELARKLGLPRTVRRAVFSGEAPTPGAARVMRFDFHPTPDGWRLSEVNSDVPGGYCEASLFTQLMAERFPSSRVPGDPAEALAASLERSAGADGVVALLAAPGYMEDIQIVSFLASLLQERGLAAIVANPVQISWRKGCAYLESHSQLLRVDAIVRFYQAEWLARLPRSSGWRGFFSGGSTPVANPGSSTISESKRLPLLWDELPVSVPAWREHLPETRDPREAPWRNDGSWIVKAAYCNTGDTVGQSDLRPPREWREMRRDVWLHPGNWIAQKRFESVPVETPAGARHACIGVYTVNGRASGAYARLSQRPLIDFESVDVALLVEDEP
jgi:glutathionylspermidine synthase